MKYTAFIFLACIASLIPAFAQDQTAEKKPKVDTAEILSRHLKGAESVADKQDQLAAMVQQLKSMVALMRNYKDIILKIIKQDGDSWESI